MGPSPAHFRRNSEFLIMLRKSPKKNPLDEEVRDLRDNLNPQEGDVRDLRDKLNSMRMGGANRSNGDNRNQRFQKTRHGDRQNGFEDRQNGHRDRQNGYEDRQSGHRDRQNGYEDRQNGHRDRQNGHGNRQNGHDDRQNGHGDQRYNRNKANRNQPHPQHQKACQSSLPL